MTFQEYQEFCEKTTIYPEHGKNLIYPTLGLVGEAGEVAEKVKKLIRDKSNVLDESMRREIAKEVGDVVWYVCRCAVELGFSFEEVMKMNLEKLNSRLEREKLHGDGDNR